MNRRGLVRRIGAAIAIAAIAVATPGAARSQPHDAISSSALSDAEATALLDQARDAARNARWAKALRLAEQILADSSNAPLQTDATLIAAIASCNLKDPARAKRYIGRLSESRKGMAKQTCLRHGIDVR